MVPTGLHDTAWESDHFSLLFSSLTTRYICWMLGGCSLVNNIFKYFQIFSNISWESPPGMFAGCWGGCSLVNNIKGREVEKQTGWMQKTRSQLLRHMFQMESLLLFPPVLRQRFRAGRQFLKRENLSGVEKCWWKNEFQQRQRFRSRSDKWDFESTSKPHCFQKVLRLVNH